MSTRPDDTTRRRPGRPRSAAVDTAIIEVALRLLAAEGFARMSMDAVAAGAGVSKATLYLRYRDKADLATAALAHLRQALEPTPTGDLRADLIVRLERVLTYADDASVMPLVGTCLAEEAHIPELLDLFRRRSVWPRREGLRELFETAEARGELREGVDIDAAIDLMMGSFQARYLAGDGIPEGWAGRVVDALLGGLRAGPEGPGG